MDNYNRVFGKIYEFVREERSLMVLSGIFVWGMASNFIHFAKEIRF